MLLATAETRRSIIDTEPVEEPELERELPGEGTAGVAARDGGAETRGAPRRAKLKLFIIVSRAETRCRYSALAPVLEGGTVGRQILVRYAIYGNKEQVKLPWHV